MKPLFVSIVVLAIALGSAPAATFAQHEDHHPDQSSEPTGSTQSARHDGAEGEGAGMGGMMGRGGMGKMHGHHGGAPSVVINIYPGGGMSMMSGAGKGMMGQHGMMRGDRMGMMGEGGMMSGGGMGMMRQGGMMSDGGMMMDRGQATDQQVTVEQVRERMAAMMERMGGGMTLGEVKELDEDLIDAELTDASGSAAGRMIINRHSGAMMRVR